MIDKLNRLTHKASRVLFAGHASKKTVDRDRIHLVSCVGVALEHVLLGHFLDHYIALGVPPANCHIVLNAESADSPDLALAEQALTARGVVAEEIWLEPYTSEAMWQKRRDVQRRCVPGGCWVLSADADEFHEYPTDLADFLGECEAYGVNCIDGVFIDRVAANGELAAIDENEPVAQRFPLQAMVQGQIVNFGRFHQPSGSVKLMAFDAALLPDRGGHRLVKHQSDARYLFGRSLTEYRQIRHPGVRFRLPLRVHHYKWHAGLRETLVRRLAQSGVSVAGREYGDQLLSYLEHRHGRIDLADIVRRPAGGHRTPLDWRARVRALRGLHFTHRTLKDVKQRLGG